MRRAVLVLMALAIAAAGCNRRSVGPTTSEYETARQQLAQEKGASPAYTPPTQRQAEAPDRGQGLGGVAAGYAYDPRGKRDPFRSFILDRVKELADAAQQERGPLEQFELGQLALVAVVWNVNRARALVQDPSGRAYVVEEGARIGKNDGKVIRIDDNLVAVRETYVDYLGERTTKEIEMRIRQSQGG